MYAYEDESPGLEKATWNRYVSFLSLNICVCKWKASKQRITQQSNPEESQQKIAKKYCF